jgi:hypothetical protein
VLTYCRSISFTGNSNQISWREFFTSKRKHTEKKNHSVMLCFEPKWKQSRVTNTLLPLFHLGDNRNDFCWER